MNSLYWCKTRVFAMKWETLSQLNHIKANLLLSIILKTSKAYKSNEIRRIKRRKRKKNNNSLVLECTYNLSLYIQLRRW